MLSAKPLSTFKDDLPGTLKLISFSWKMNTRCWVQNSVYLGQKKHSLIILYYTIFLPFFFFSGDIWDTVEVVLVQLIHCLKVPEKLLLFENSVWCGHLLTVKRTQTKALFFSSISSGTAKPSISATFLCQQLTHLAVITPCIFRESFTDADAVPHPSAAPFIRKRFCGSRPRPPMLLWQKSLALGL